MFSKRVSVELQYGHRNTDDCRCTNVGAPALREAGIEPIAPEQVLRALTGHAAPDRSTLRRLHRPAPAAVRKAAHALLDDVAALSAPGASHCTQCLALSLPKTRFSRLPAPYDDSA